MASMNDRAQQILIAGLLLAIMLTALVIVLNGTLYTEDLRTRDAGNRPLAADDYEQELARELGRTLDRVNDVRRSNRTVLERTVLNATFATNELFGRQYASTQAAYASIDPVRIEDGTHISQDQTCYFTALNPDCNAVGDQPIRASFTYSDDNGDDWIHASNEDLLLNGSASDDFDNETDDLSYEWTLTEGTKTVTATGAEPTINASDLDRSGFWNITLTVSDDGQSASATAFLPVHKNGDADEPPPRARFTHDPTVPIAGEQVSLDASTTTDTDNDIQGYDWTIDGPDGSTSTPTGETTTFTPPTAGEYTVTLRVSDTVGNTDRLIKTISVEERLADGGGRTADTDNDGTPNPPFRVGEIPRDGYLAVGESGAPVNASNWTLVEDATARQFEIETTDFDTLASVPEAQGNDSAAIADTFYVEVTGNDGKTWEVHIFNGSDTKQFFVTTIAPDGTTDVRARTNTKLSVDITAGEVNGRQVFPFAPGLTRPYDIAYRNGDKISGSYEMTLATGSSASTRVQTANFYAPSDDRSPYAGPAVYAINAPATYDAGDISRRGVVRVAPDEPTLYGRGISLPTSSPSYESREGIVYVSGDSEQRLYSIEPDGTQIDYGVTGVQVIGPRQVDLDADDTEEIPYVSDNGDLKIVDANGEKQTLVDASDSAAPLSPDNPNSNYGSAGTLLAIGEWRGSFSVFYPGTGSDGSGNPVIYRVGAGGVPEKVTETEGGSTVLDGKAVGGIHDFNDDGDADLMYTGDSQQVFWIDNGTRNDNAKSTNSVAGFGQPRDITVNGALQPRLPFITGSSYVGLMDDDGNTDTPTTDVAAASQPVAIFDWNDDGSKEVIYVNSNDDTLYYVTVDGTITQITVDGSPVTVNSRIGVA